MFPVVAQLTRNVTTVDVKARIYVFIPTPGKAKPHLTDKVRTFFFKVQKSAPVFFLVGSRGTFSARYRPIRPEL